MSKESGVFELDSLEDIGSQGNVESPADKSLWQENIFLAVAHAHLPEHDQFEQFSW